MARANYDSLGLALVQWSLGIRKTQDKAESASAAAKISVRIRISDFV